MQSYIWRRINIDVPENWEMLSYSTNFDNGRCYFGDRYQHRLMFRWRVVLSELDMKKMAVDYASYISLRDDILYAKPVSCYQWEGVEAKLPDASYSTYSSYIDVEKLLVELIFLTPGETDSKQEQKILSSVKMEPLQLEHYRRWFAFGMDMVTDDNFILKKCKVLPGLSVMNFSHVKDHNMYDSFERFGMVDEWLCGPVDEWAKRRIPDGVKIVNANTEEYRGHIFHTINGKIRTGIGKQIRGIKYSYLSRTWRCPIDNRLYCYSSVYNTNDENKPLDSDRLHCCENLR